MKQIFSKLAWGTLLLVVLLGGVGFVVASILSTLNLSLADLMQKDTTITPEPDIKVPAISEPITKAPLPPLPLPTQPDEIKSYSLFTTVKNGASAVTTGIRYSSTLDRSIALQWCYVAETASKGQSYTNLPLAEIDANGIKAIPKFTDTALATFDLNQTTVRALIESHCRFQ